VLFYLAAYTVMVAGSFGVVTLVGRTGDGRHTLDDYKGLGRTSPLLAGMFTIFLLAQAGVPFTVGFVAKFYAVIAAVNAGSTILAIIAMVSATVAAFLYLRIIVAMYMAEGDDGGLDRPVTRGQHIRVPFAAGLSLVLCLIATIGFGLFPGPLTDVASNGTPALVREPVPVETGAAPGT
jgi:NADH-quinone oxidoreductase subunit N